MKNLLIILAITAASFLAGCATQSPAAIAHARSRGVSEGVIYKLQTRGSLAPEDLIELHRKRVHDDIPLRQLDVDGVNYAVQPDEITRLRNAGVPPVVQDALIDASDRFVADRYAPPRPYYGYGALVPAPVYYDEPYYLPRPTIGLGLGVGYARGYRRCY